MAEAADPLSMSLDDIIKAKAEKVQGERRASGRGRRGTGNRAGSSSLGRGAKKLRSAGGEGRVTVTVRNGGVQKQRTNVRKNLAPMAEVERDPAALHGDKRWSHDLYQDSGPRRARQPGGGVSGTLLNLSNLDYKVTDEDIQELFATVGPVKKAGINFDSGDRADGTAYVIFERREDAAQAIKRYNNVALDGKPMKIELAKPGIGGSTRLSSGLSVGTGRSAGNSVFSRALSDAQGNGGGFETGSRQQGGMRSDSMMGGNRLGGGSRRGGRGRGGVTRANRSGADLDADLDAYMQE